MASLDLMTGPSCMGSPARTICDTQTGTHSQGALRKQAWGTMHTNGWPPAFRWPGWGSRSTGWEAPGLQKPGEVTQLHEPGDRGLHASGGDAHKLAGQLCPGLLEAHAGPFLLDAALSPISCGPLQQLN